MQSETQPFTGEQYSATHDGGLLGYSCKNAATPSRMNVAISGRVLFRVTIFA
jgi:hypothetical protein